MKVLLFVTFFAVLLATQRAAALDLSDLQGAYLATCQSLAGLPADYRVTEYLSISDNVAYWVTLVYFETSCDGTADLRYDRVAQLRVGGSISAGDWTGSGPLAFQKPTNKLSQQHIKKLLTPVTSDGRAFLEAACPSQTWATGVSTDVFSQTCAGFFYACSASDNTEYTCVTQNDGGSLAFCQRSASGSCSADDRVLSYFATAGGALFQYAQRDPDSYIDMSDLAGAYERTCVPLFGLPAGWRISESTQLHSDGSMHMVNSIYADTSCDNLAFRYDRTVQGYFGADTDYPSVLETYPIQDDLREFAQYYIEKKYKDISQAGADFLNTLCPAARNWQPADSVDIIDIDCPPFTPACSSGDHWEYIQLAKGTDDGFLRFANNPVGDFSCSPAQYSASVFLSQEGPPPPFNVYTVDPKQSSAASTAVVTIISVFASFILFVLF